MLDYFSERGVKFGCCVIIGHSLGYDNVLGYYD